MIFHNSSSKILLLILLIFITNTSIVSQTNSDQPQLQNLYQGAILLVPNGGTKVSYVIFEYPSKVIIRTVIEMPLTPKTFPFANSNDFVGSFKQVGNKIIMDFPDGTVEAFIVPDGLEGIYASKETKKKQSWVVATTSISKLLEPLKSNITKSDLEKLNQTAFEYFKKKNYKESLKYFNLYIKNYFGINNDSNLELSRAYFGRGRVNYFLRNYNQALADFNTIFKIIDNMKPTENTDATTIKALSSSISCLVYAERAKTKRKLGDVNGAKQDEKKTCDNFKK